MSVPSQTRRLSSNTSTIYAQHDLELSLIAGVLEVAAKITRGVNKDSRSGSRLYSISRTDSVRVDVVEVVDGEVLGTTCPDWLTWKIRDLIKLCNLDGLIIHKLDL